MARPMLIAGNWKMNGLRADIAEVEAIAGAAMRASANVEVALAPPFTLISAARAAAPGLLVGGQDCHARSGGAHTGGISASMLADLGCGFVIVGHSERRAENGETDADVRAKAEAALAAGLRVIVCVGETETERDAGRADEIVAGQLAGSLPEGGTDRLVVAYEPVWAIGTGRTPSRTDVEAMHAGVRAGLVERFGDAASGIPILYGGSVKPSNAAELLGAREVGGALVGGASLTARDFVPIIEAAATA